MTAKNYLRRLEDFYLVFSVRPYTRNIKRSLLKARKYYLYDWTHISDLGIRFENYLACELKTRLALWRDAGGKDYQLCYVRNKQKQETDFLILCDDVPWLLVESKTSDGVVERHHIDTQIVLNNIPVVQICRQTGVAALQRNNLYRMSADRFFS